MKLPAGATGFNAAWHDPDFMRRFMGACHTAARSIGGEVRKGVVPDLTRSFHVVEFYCRAGATEVLLHASLPAVAFALPRREGLEIVFVDNPALASTLSEPAEIEIWSAHYLATELSRVDLSELDPAELTQVAYWQPATVGELLFNFWD